MKRRKPNLLILLVMVIVMVMVFLTTRFLVKGDVFTLAKKGKTIDVGFMSPFEGRISVVAMETFKAMNLCLSQNNIGFVNIKTASVSTPDDVSNAYFSLKDDVDKIYFMGLTSAMLSSADTLLTTREDMIFNLFSTSDKFSFRDDLYIRVVPDAKLESETITKYINKAYVKKKLFIIQDEHNASYTESALKYFTNTIDVQYILSKFNFKKNKPQTIMETIGKQKFDVVYILASGVVTYEVGVAVQQIKKAHPKATVIINPWSNTRVYNQAAGKSADGTILPSLVPLDSDCAKVKKYREDFKTMYGDYPKTIHSFIGYESMEILIEALKAGKRTPNQIKKFILEKDEFNTLLGKIKFDKYGDVVREYNFYRLENGDMVNVE